MGNFNDIVLHRNEVRDNILKSFNSEFDELEKGKWNVGDTKVYQGITWEVGGFNAKGAPLWRKAKGGAGSGATNNDSSDKKNNDKNTSNVKNNKSEEDKIFSRLRILGSKINVSDISKEDWDRSVSIMRQTDPNKISAVKSLTEDKVSDKFLTIFREVSNHLFLSSGKNESESDRWRDWRHLATGEINERMLKLRSDLDELKNSKNTPSSNNASNNNKEKTIDKKQTNKNSTFAKNVVDKIKKVLKNTTISNDQLQKLENAISNDEENAKKILSIKFPKTKDVDLKSPESEAIKVVDLGNYEMICRTYKSYNFNISRGKSDPLVLENYSITLRNKVKDSKIIRHDSSWIPGFYDKEDNQQKCIIGALYSYYKHKENF